MNNCINKINERSIFIIHNDLNISFMELLNKNGSFTIHQRNLKLLATEVFMENKNLGPELMNNQARHQSFQFRGAKICSIAVEEYRPSWLGHDNFIDIGRSKTATTCLKFPSNEQYFA